MTHSELIIKYLTEVNKEEVIDYPTTKYVVLTRLYRLMDGSKIPESKTPVYWFVGKMGALRVGTTINDSRSVSHNITAEIIKRAKGLS